MSIEQLIEQTADEISIIARGGPGSGHHGHKGRPGEVGGSQPGESVEAEAERLAEEHRAEYEANRQGWEQDLLEKYGEGEWHTGIWIGPSGKYLAPLEDHQATALEMMGWKADLMTQEGMERGASATDAVVALGLVRYNLAEADAYFDIPSVDDTTDSQWALMAAAVTKFNQRIRKDYGEPVMADVTISIGAGLRGIKHEKLTWGREAYEWLGLEEEYDYGVYRGGPGSGHHGHKGRPGEVGGSAPSGKDPRGKSELLPAARLALKYDDFEGMKRDWLVKNYHGTYFHLTNDPDFKINPKQAPREGSSLASGENRTPGLMVTTDLANWEETLGPRPYTAIIELDKLEPGVDYRDSTRGFGAEIFIFKPADVSVIDVVPTKEAHKISDRLYDEIYPQSERELREIWDWAHANLTERGGPGSGHHGHAGRPGEVGGSKPGDGWESEAKDYVDRLRNPAKRKYAQELINVFHFNTQGFYPSIPEPEQVYKKDRWTPPNNQFEKIFSDLSEMAPPPRDEPNFDELYPPIGDEVEGREIRLPVPNTDSISASFTEWKVLDDIREMRIDDFFMEGQTPSYYSVDKRERTQDLAEALKTSDWIEPLIVGVDKDGPHILEGGHRIDALRELGEDTFPAMVVIDLVSLPIVERGGPGSGHFQHEGRPGEVGGSLPSGEGVVELETGPQVRDAMYDHAKATKDSWTDDELAGVRKYTSLSYRLINKLLRQGEKSYIDQGIGHLDEIKEIINRMDEAMAKSTTDRDLIGWRAMRVESELARQFAEGVEYIDKGFASTTVASGMVKHFLTPSQWQAKIFVPKGTHAIFTGIEGISDHKGEAELVIDRNTRYRVRSFDQSALVIELEVVP